MNTFIFSSSDVQVVRDNTVEVIPGRYRVMIDGATIIYHLQEKSVTILSEEFDGRKMEYEGKPGEEAREYVLICAYHNVNVLNVGNNSCRAYYIINLPTGEYIAEERGGVVTLHHKNGTLFIKVDGVYLNCDHEIDNLKRRYHDRGSGLSIPKDYLFRVKDQTGKFEYYPVQSTYQSKNIFDLNYPKATAVDWVTCEKFLK